MKKELFKEINERKVRVCDIWPKSASSFPLSQLWKVEKLLQTIAAKTTGPLLGHLLCQRAFSFSWRNFSASPPAPSYLLLRLSSRRESHWWEVGLPSSNGGSTLGMEPWEYYGTDLLGVTHEVEVPHEEIETERDSVAAPYTEFWTSKGGGHAERGLPFALCPVLKPCFTDFCLKREADCKMDSPLSLPKGIDFICMKKFKSKTLSWTVEVVVKGNWEICGFHEDAAKTLN